MKCQLDYHFIKQRGHFIHSKPGYDLVQRVSRTCFAHGKQLILALRKLNLFSDVLR